MLESKHSEIMKELRKDRKISQTKIAEDLKITQRMYSTYETGDRTPTIDILMEIANYFNVTLDFLTGNETKRLEPLTEEERKMLKNYRELNETHQNKVIERIETLREMQQGA
ncbi:MAG: helix-turn-helix domain-containing protein [Ruminococcus sp.]|nr:helix-turn-helix domain-containing protein [Ruminococcus sp.]